MRIALYIFSLSGGAGKNVALLARRFSQSGHEVDVVCVKGSQNLLCSLGTAAVHIIPAVRAIFAFFGIARYLKKTNPDVIVVTGPINQLAVFFASTFSGYKGDLIIRESISLSAWFKTISLLKKGLVLSFLPMSYRRARKIVALTNDMATELRDRFCIDPEKISVIPNGIAVDSDWVKSQRQVSYDVVFCGRLVEQKRVDLLLTSVARLAGQGRSLRVAIVGDGKLRSSLERLAIRLDISDQVSFLGFRTDVSDIFRQSRVFVLPSAYEGFPNVVVEALAEGLPVVSTDSIGGGAREVLNTTGGGIVVDSFTATAIADGIEAALERAWDWSKIRMNLIRYDVEYMLDCYMDLVLKERSQ